MPVDQFLSFTYGCESKHVPGRTLRPSTIRCGLSWRGSWWCLLPAATALSGPWLSSRTGLWLHWHPSRCLLSGHARPITARLGKDRDNISEFSIGSFTSPSIFCDLSLFPKRCVTLTEWCCTWSGVGRSAGRVARVAFLWLLERCAQRGVHLLEVLL